MEDSFLPICQRCGDILRIEINPLTFNISIFCDNENLSKIISYQKFNAKYLKNINSLSDELKNKKYLPKYLLDEIEININNNINANTTHLFAE